MSKASEYLKMLMKPLRPKHEIYHFKFTQAITNTTVGRFLDAVRKHKLDKPKVLMVSINTAFGSVSQTEILVEGLQQVSHSLQAPLYTFIEDFALGPGYYLATAGDKVHANPFSLIGDVNTNQKQIGFSKLLQKYNVQYQINGPESILLDAFQAVSEQQRSFVDRELAIEFATLIDGIKKNRHQIKDNLQGVFTADQAKESKLIDEVTTFEEFVATLYPKHKVREVTIVKGGPSRQIITAEIQTQMQSLDLTNPKVLLNLRDKFIRSFEELNPENLQELMVSYMHEMLIQQQYK